MYFKILIAASLAANFLPVNAENEYLAKAESMHPASVANGNLVSPESVFADSSKVFDIDEIVVVSQPKETRRLRQQALSSSSLSSFQMHKLGVHDLRELSQYIPNFVMPITAVACRLPSMCVASAVVSTVLLWASIWMISQ